MRRIVTILLVLFGVFVCEGFGQLSHLSGNKAQNLRDCIDGFETCDHALLSPT